MMTLPSNRTDLTRLACGHTGRVDEPCIHPDHDVPRVVRVSRDRLIGWGVAFGFSGACWFGLIWAVAR